MRHLMFLVMGACLGTAMFTSGCTSSSQLQKDQMTFRDVSIEAQFTRDDVIVMDQVEGTSSTTNILGGIVQIVDNKNLRLLGIPFYKEKYTYWGKPGFLGYVTTLDRAYYKMLEQNPYADTIFIPSYMKEESGFPLILGTETVTVKGRAAKMKADN